MKQRPILFSAPMVRALLDGTKTLTRRIVKPQPVVGQGMVNAGYCGHHNLWLRDGHCDESDPAKEWRCPYGKPGDRLWVRETFQRFTDDGEIIYKADPASFELMNDLKHDEYPEARWRPAIHMPRWASRITLEITGVRVERLQDISNDDAYSEGTGTWAAETAKDGNKWPSMPRAFRGLWESINGAESWATNPWVWVIQFKRLEQPA